MIQTFSKFWSTIFIDSSKSQCDHIISTCSSHTKGNLFLGGVLALEKDTISKHRISSVVTIMHDFVHWYYNVDEKIAQNSIKNHKWINLKDKSSADISLHFKESSQFIRDQLKDHNVLVHCRMGRSRSSTLVIAFLMEDFKMPFEKAISYAVQKRSIVEPNQGFIEHLKQFQKYLIERETKFESKSNA